MKKIFLISFLITSFFISCELYPQDDYEQQYVVESYLMANNLLPKVRLSTTSPAGDFYDYDDTAINFANVEIRLLESGPNSEVEESFNFFNSGPGVFLPNQNHKVIPRRTYQLHISFTGNNDIITAHTVVPDTFQILAGIQDSIIYQSNNQLNIHLTKSYYPGRQNIYVFNAISLNPAKENLTPFYADLFEGSEQPEDDLYQLSNNSSGILNEANFEENPDGTITLNYPWIGIAFYEGNQIIANTIDDNVYDFVRSQQVQLGGSTLSPGEIQNVIYHVEGGIGVFGALASDTIQTYVKRPEF
ncbi:MAG: DUF4249 family protein [Gracilimonas sp.]